MDNTLEWLDKVLDEARRELAEWAAAERMRQRAAAEAFWPPEALRAARKFLYDNN